VSRKSRLFLAPVCFFVDLLRFCSLVTISQGKKISVHRGSTAVVSLEKFQENTSTSLEFASFACSLSVSKDPMGDVSLNRPINADPPAGGIAKGNRILDMMSAGWTDERHMLYISSMEASFVHQLYNHGNHPHNAHGNGFKVLRRGVWEYIKYERTNPRVQSGTKCCLPANPWIQHFRPRDCGSNAQSDGLEASVGDHESGTQTNRKRLSVSHGREWEACKGDNKLLGESTEVSDQNFADDEAEVEAESSKARKKRRLSSTSHYCDE